MERLIPESMQATYHKAMTGRSKSASIRAFCQECCGYERHEVSLCTDTGCPHYLYRPYRSPKCVAAARKALTTAPDGQKPA